MSSLSNLPAQAVLPLGAYDLASLRREALRADQRWIHVNCTHARNRAEVLAAIAREAEFPEYFGATLDALYDCTTELTPRPGADRPGIVLVLEALPESGDLDAQARRALIDVFREAADFFYDRSIAFRLFYSVRQVGA